MMSVLTTHLQHCTRSPRQNSKARKSLKCIHFGKEEMKLSLFTEDIIIYVEKHEESVKPKNKTQPPGTSQ